MTLQGMSGFYLTLNEQEICGPREMDFFNIVKWLRNGQLSKLLNVKRGPRRLYFILIVQIPYFPMIPCVLDHDNTVSVPINVCVTSKDLSKK